MLNRSTAKLLSLCLVLAVLKAAITYCVPTLMAALIAIVDIYYNINVNLFYPTNWRN